MAVVRTQDTKKGKKVQAIVRKHGHSVSRVFSRSTDAKDWAKRVEVAIETSSKDRPFIKSDWLPKRKEAINAQALADKPQISWSLDRALEHYGKTISVLKKGWSQELRRIAQWRRNPIAKKGLCDLTKADIKRHIGSRTESKISGSTIRKEVMLLRALYRDAEEIWELEISNPCERLKLPQAPDHRKRRLQDGRGGEAGEYQRLRKALLGLNRGDELVDLFDLAIETALRRSELLFLREHFFTSEGGVHKIMLPDSKSGRARDVILSPRALEIVCSRIKGKLPMERLFTVSESALARFWGQALKQCNITGLTWHDLRHEALTRMHKLGMGLPELQAQAGHTTPMMTMRYVNITDCDIANKYGNYTSANLT